MAAAKVAQPVSMDVDTGDDSRDKQAVPDGERKIGQDSDKDLYTRLKTLQRQLEFFEIQVTECTLLHCL